MLCATRQRKWHRVPGSRYWNALWYCNALKKVSCFKKHACLMLQGWMGTQSNERTVNDWHVRVLICFLEFCQPRVGSIFYKMPDLLWFWFCTFTKTYFKLNVREYNQFPVNKLYPKNETIYILFFGKSSKKETEEHTYCLPAWRKSWLFFILNDFCLTVSYIL